MRRLRGGGWFAIGLALVWAGGGSCSSGTGPVAGVLTVSLATPNPGADGALLLTVTGPTALTSVTAAPGGGLRVFSQTLSATNRFAVTGPLQNGAILTIGVADVNRVSQYAASVQEVAANDYGLRAVTGYSLTVSR